MRVIVLAAALALSACVSTNVSIVDSKTSLEQQAAGSYPTLARELEEAAIQPGPVPLTREQLTAAAADAPPAPTEAGEPTDAARVDALLTRRCIGEAREGRLVFTRASCAGNPDEQDVAALIERANRSRQRVWTYLGSLQPGASAADVRAAWRSTRLRELVCGAQVQNAEGGWELKKC